MKKILIIEDDPRLALALSVRLKANGYATWIAVDCITAVSTAVEIKPDLILLDVSLPAGNGFSLIEQFEWRPPPMLKTSPAAGRRKKHQNASARSREWILSRTCLPLYPKTVYGESVTAHCTRYARKP